MYIYIYIYIYKKNKESHIRGTEITGALSGPKIRLSFCHTSGTERFLLYLQGLFSRKILFAVLQVHLVENVLSTKIYPLI